MNALTFAFLVFVALAILAARLDYLASREQSLARPCDDLVRRRETLARLATERETTTRGERRRPSAEAVALDDRILVAELHDAFDYAYLTQPDRPLDATSESRAST